MPQEADLMMNLNIKNRADCALSNLLAEEKTENRPLIDHSKVDDQGDY